jgi:Spy/CpxP family protein refolding chaperone
MRRTLTITVGLVLIVAFAASAFAEEGRRADAMKRIEMIRIWRLTESLNLTANEGAKIFPILQRFDKQFQEKMQTKEELVDQLVGELGKDAINAAKLTSLSERILKLEDESMEVRKAMYKELREIMTPEQLARYMIFEVSFQREIDEIIQQVRKNPTGISIRKFRKTNPPPKTKQ